MLKGRMEGSVHGSIFRPAVSADGMQVVKGTVSDGFEVG